MSLFPDNFRCLWIRDRMAWQPYPSGYDFLCQILGEMLPGKHQSIFADQPVPAPIAWALQPLSKKFKKSPSYSIRSTYAEVKCLINSHFYRPSLAHVFFLERCYGVLSEKKKHGKHVATAHQPPAWWESNYKGEIEGLQSLDGLIVMSRAMEKFFKKYLPEEKIFFMRYGVDTDFFKPLECADEAVVKENAFEHARFVCCGHWLRDFRTLADVIDAVLRENSQIYFDVVLHEELRGNSDLVRIAGRAQVKWHSHLSSEALKDIYGRATALLLPLTDSGANNAVVEAVACGLPLITTQIGGIPDYVDPAFAETFPVGDAQGMKEVVLRAADNKLWKKARSHHARKFALDHLTWKEAAQKTLDVYRQITFR